MICSSVNRLCLISLPPRSALYSNYNWRSFWGRSSTLILPSFSPERNDTLCVSRVYESRRFVPLSGDAGKKKGQKTRGCLLPLSQLEMRGQASRPISTPPLKPLRVLHSGPIKPVISRRSSGALRHGRSHLGVGFALRCFQRLSLPDMATQRLPLAG